MKVVESDHRFSELGTEELLRLLLRLNRAELTLRFPAWNDRMLRSGGFSHRGSNRPTTRGGVR
jgi:hypothetical protein